jgi:amino acid adenylation domain-containing protein
MLMGERFGELLPPPAMTYRDFVLLEKRTCASEATQQFWARNLEGVRINSMSALAQLDPLPKTGKTDAASVPISPVVSTQLRRLSVQASVPVKTVLLAVHLRVMSLLAGETYVLTGLVVNGRPETADGDRVLGLFLNTVPFRQQLCGGSWLDLIKQTFETERQMLAHRRYPLARLQSAFGREPLFRSAFNFVHFHILEQMVDLEFLQVHDARAFDQTNFLLMAEFSIDLVTSCIALKLKFGERQMAPRQVALITEYYARALESVSTDPLARYEQQSLLSRLEQHQILVEWNDKARTVDPRPVHERIQRWAEVKPDSIAIACEEVQHSFSHLNEMANRIASRLSGLGAGPEVLVGILMERSLTMVAALLGVTKASAAYLPLDPEFPPQRNEFMLADAGVRLILARSNQAGFLATHNLTLVDVDAALRSTEPGDDRVTGSLLSPRNLAYVIYTSGSTGRPKGVLIQHHSLSSFIDSMQERLGCSTDEVFLASTSLSFDIAALEVFLPLCLGARLELAGPKLASDPSEVATIILNSQVTIVQATPSAWSILLESGWEPVPDTVALCGGEALNPELANRLARAAGQVWNLYGPTETTIWSAASSVQCGCRFVEIGRPIGNTQIYILDEHLQPARALVPGHILIGGAGLARGYLGRPAQTAERFCPDPYSGVEGGRLYLAGDRGRFNVGGSIEFLGRIDNQVKIRGHRIEPAEIEACLLAHPAVRNAVVVPQADGAGDTRLIAYVDSSQPEAITEDSLRLLLKQSLPAHMLPSSLVLLESLPLLPNGKLDRRALPEPGSPFQAVARVLVPPRNPLQEMLIDLWRNILNAGPIGVTDDFFDLGGHSLLAMRLTALVRRIFTVELSIKQFFERATIDMLSEWITANEPFPGHAAKVAAAVRTVKVAPGFPPDTERVGGDQ